MLNIAISGVSGRMGRALIEAVIDSSKEPENELRLSGAIHKPNGDLVGMDAGRLIGSEESQVSIVAALAEADFDVLIDFTTTETTLNNLDFCLQHNKAMVIGTTGFSPAQQGLISRAGEQIPLVFAANMSVGMNLCFHLLKQMSQVMAEDADIEIIEAHHRHKVDSPSGTALRLGQVIADSLGRDLSDCAVYGRQGMDGPRDKDTIGFATVRGGDVVGDHTVLFASEGERLELTHKASSRMTFAKGAVRAAKWLRNRKNGFYDMEDVLDLR